MADKEKEDKNLMESIKHILGKEDKINDQLDNGRLVVLNYAKDLLLLMSLVKDYYRGNYRNIPYKTISAAVVGLLYVLNPIDLIPDFIPFIGQVDDALVLRFCLKLMEKDLSKYKKWKEQQTDSEKEAEELTTRRLMRTKKRTLKLATIKKKVRNNRSCLRSAMIPIIACNACKNSRVNENIIDPAVFLIPQSQPRNQPCQLTKNTLFYLLKNHQSGTS